MERGRGGEARGRRSIMTRGGEEGKETMVEEGKRGEKGSRDGRSAGKGETDNDRASAREG